jgi:P-type E1-E2 ATPase
MLIEIPGRGALELSILILDLNGTIAIDGAIIAGVAERVAKLKSRGLEAYLLTADTRGNGADIAAHLDVALHRLAPGSERAQKAAFVRQRGADQVVAIGNGANDAEMLAQAALGIAVLQVEGLAVETWAAADLLVPDVCNALDLLIEPQRLVATLRY